MPAGGENGFNQAIELSADTLANVKFVQEKRLISKFFDEISQDTNKYVFGVADTLQCLEMGAVETLVVWEDLQVYRYTLMNSTSGELVLYFVHTWRAVLGQSCVVLGDVVHMCECASSQEAQWQAKTAVVCVRCIAAGHMFRPAAFSWACSDCTAMIVLPASLMLYCSVSHTEGWVNSVAAVEQVCCHVYHW